MRWLVTGAGGQVGSRVVDALARAGDPVTAPTHAELDVTDRRAVRQLVREARPNVIINAAAYTRVDDAEDEEESAAAVNARAPAHLGDAARDVSARLVHISTDYVFDGTAAVPYEPDARVAPLSAYGRTKLAGERAVLAAGCDALIVRTAWVWGGPGRNFVDTMHALARSGARPRVVADQRGSPTYAADLADALIAAAVAPGIPTVLHYAGAGDASWYELAAAVFEATGHDPSVITLISSVEYATRAPRPRWSVLSTRHWTAAGLPAPTPWREAVARWAATVRGERTDPEPR